MTNNPLPGLASNHYWLTNAHIPLALLTNADAVTQATREGLARVDLEICAGVVSQIVPAGTSTPASDTALSLNRIDLRQGIVFPCFVDMHTHLDKGHSWERSPNREGSFDCALETVEVDRQTYWRAEDVYRRMEFGLKCSYAHGTRALRTHIDSFGEQATISLGVFKQLQQQWGDRLTLQASSLVSLDYFMTPAGEKLADQIAEVGGVLGGLPLPGEALDAELDRVFDLAQERGLNLDFHTDETGDPTFLTLRSVAAAALRHQFTGQIVCGHCCSLATQSLEDVIKTLDLVKQANVGIVSLPMCNLYLQDREQVTSRYFAYDKLGHNLAHLPQIATHTPRWRGVTLAHEIKHAGIPIAFASDNCRDPFYGFGDHDVLEVLTQSVRIAHLDTPYSDWCRSVTTTPADLMGLPTLGRIGVGLPADLILFKARYFSELLARHQGDRIVLRNGAPIDTTLPDYAELDDLVGLG